MPAGVIVPVFQPASSSARPIARTVPEDPTTSSQPILRNASRTGRISSAAVVCAFFNRGLVIFPLAKNRLLMATHPSERLCMVA